MECTLPLPAVIAMLTTSIAVCSFPQVSIKSSYIALQRSENKKLYISVLSLYYLQPQNNKRSWQNQQKLSLSRCHLLKKYLSSVDNQLDCRHSSESTTTHGFTTSRLSLSISAIPRDKFRREISTLPRHVHLNVTSPVFQLIIKQVR